MKYKIDKKNAICGARRLGKWRENVSAQAQKIASEHDDLIINHRVRAGGEL